MYTQIHYIQYVHTYPLYICMHVHYRALIVSKYGWRCVFKQMSTTVHTLCIQPDTAWWCVCMCTCSAKTCMTILPRLSRYLDECTLTRVCSAGTGGGGRSGDGRGVAYCVMSCCSLYVCTNLTTHSCTLSSGTTYVCMYVT